MQSCSYPARLSGCFHLSITRFADECSLNSTLEFKKKKSVLGTLGKVFFEDAEFLTIQEMSDCSPMRCTVMPSESCNPAGITPELMQLGPSEIASLEHDTAESLALQFPAEDKVCSFKVWQCPVCSSL